MAATWKIETMDFNLSDGSVTTAHWRVTDSETVGDNTYTASSYGACSFTPDPSAADFVAYDSLTEAGVLQWCWDSDVDKDAVEAGLTARIAEQKTPTQGEGVPW